MYGEVARRSFLSDHWGYRYSVRQWVELREIEYKILSQNYQKYKAEFEGAQDNDAKLT